MPIPTDELNLENATDYHYDKFPPSNLQYEVLLTAFGKATEALSRFDQMLRNMHNSSILLSPLRNQEAVISSRMEGTVSTMDEILRYEADHIDGEDDRKSSAGVRSEVVETFLYRHALTKAQSAIDAGQPISKFFIKQIHQTLLSFGRGVSQSPGQFKVQQNFLADRTRRNILFIPISPTKLEEGMDNLFDYLEKSDHPALFKIALSHIEFEALHPFKDGNGRIGRMLITLLMWNYGLISSPHFYISEYMEENKEMYVDSMRNVSKIDDWTSWCQFFFEAVERQANRNLEIADNIRQLYEEMKGVFADLLASQYSVKALDFIFTNPVFRNNKFTNTEDIPHYVAAKFSRKLHSYGLLRMIEPASGRRPAMYSFEPLVELVRV